MGHVAPQPAGRVEVLRHGQSAVWALPQLGSHASSARAWRLWAARHSLGEAEPLDTQPLPRVLELAASKASSFTAFDHPGGAPGWRVLTNAESVLRSSGALSRAGL